MARTLDLHKWACGAYTGILSDLEPKPDLAILAIAGQPCVNGAGFSGTVSEFIVDSIHRLDEPKKVVWALHDKSPIPPYYIDTSALDEAVQKQTRSEILTLHHAVPQVIFDSHSSQISGRNIAKIRRKQVLTAVWLYGVYIA
jgi:hypothetical protein